MTIDPEDLRRRAARAAARIKAVINNPNRYNRNDAAPEKLADLILREMDGSADFDRGVVEGRRDCRPAREAALAALRAAYRYIEEPATGGSDTLPLLQQIGAAGDDVTQALRLGDIA